MAARYCLVNPFGKYHEVDYTHLEVKCPVNDPEHEEIMKIISRQYNGNEEAFSSEISKRELANPDKMDYYSDDRFENLRFIRKVLK